MCAGDDKYKNVQSSAHKIKKGNNLNVHVWKYKNKMWNIHTMQLTTTVKTRDESDL